MPIETFLSQPVWAIILILFGLLMGGLVKGMLGIGLPLVAMPFLLFATDIQSAMLFLVGAMITTNIYQVFERGDVLTLTKQYAVLLVMVVIGVYFGVQILTGADVSTLNLIVGLSLIGISAVLWKSPRFVFPEPYRLPGEGIIGLAAGVLGGITSLFAPFFVTYLAARQLRKDQFVSEISFLYMVCVSILVAMLIWQGVITTDAFPALFLGIVCCHVGLFLGQKMRGLLDEGLFHKLVLLTMALSGVNLIWKSF